MPLLASSIPGFFISPIYKANFFHIRYYLYFYVNRRLLSMNCKVWGLIVDQDLKKKKIFFRVIFMDVPIRDRRIQGCYHVISPLINPVDERGHFTVDDVTDVPSKLKLVMSIDGGGGGGRGQLV